MGTWSRAREHLSNNNNNTKTKQGQMTNAINTLNTLQHKRCKNGYLQESKVAPGQQQQGNNNNSSTNNNTILFIHAFINV